MDATNKRRENLSWPDQKEINAQLETIRELAKGLRTDCPTDTADEPTNWNNKARNRRNALICAQFLDNGTFSLVSGSEWLELFDLLGFSVDKETRKRFASHLNWYSFWYADFKPRLSSKYAQRIHWYVHNFLFCLRNKLQAEKGYQEGKLTPLHNPQKRPEFQRERQRRAMCRLRVKVPRKRPEKQSIHLLVAPDEFQNISVI